MSNIRVRFKIRMNELGQVGSYPFIGLIRGLDKSGVIVVENSIETESTKEFYVIDVQMDFKNFDIAKGQAESYGVVVERLEK